VFHCSRCGQRVVFFGGWAPPDHPELASGVCSTCRMRERAEGLPAADVEAIRAAASGGVLPAVKVVSERLGWSLNEAVSLVHVLSSQANRRISRLWSTMPRHITVRTRTASLFFHHHPPPHAGRRLSSTGSDAPPLLLLQQANVRQQERAISRCAFRDEW
jgi:hypothetical protein